MANIQPITEATPGAEVRARINESFGEANKVAGKAEQTALTAETNARNAAVANLQGQIGQRATTIALTSAVSALQQADQAETAARIAGDKARVTYAEASSEPTRPGEANRFFTSDLVGDPASVAPLPDSWKVVGTNGASIAIPGAGKVATLGVRRVEQQRQYRFRAVIQRATNTEDPANDAIRIGLQWLDQNKGDAGRTICVDLVDITTASGRLGYFFNFATADADNIDFTAPAGAVYVRPFVQAFGSGITHVEVIEIVDLTDSVEFSPDVSEWMRQLAGFNWRLEDATTRLDGAEEDIAASRNASWFTEGTLNDARLSGNVLFRDKEQTVTAAKTFVAELRMKNAILIGDGEVENPGDAEAPTATARIAGDGDHLSIAPTDKAGGFNTLRELTYSHIYNVWLAEGGFRTTGTIVATEDGQIGRDLTVGRDSGVTRHLTVGENAGIGGDLEVAGSAQVSGDLGVEQNLGVLGAATVGETLDVAGVTTLDDDLSVGGDAAIAGGATVGGALGVTGNATIGGTMVVTGTTTLTDLTVSGTSIIGVVGGEEISLSAGTGKLILNPGGANWSMMLEAGAFGYFLDPEGLSFVQAGNTPISVGSGFFIPVKRKLDFFSNADFLDALGESADAFAIPNGVYRITGNTAGTWPSTYHKPGILIITGDETQIFQALHTHTGRVYQRSARLVSSVMTWGAWVRIGGTEVVDYQGFNDDSARVIALGESLTRYKVELVDNEGRGGIFSCRSSTSNLQVSELCSNRTFGRYLTALTGTTGTDGQWNIGVQDQTLYIENRTGATRSATVFINRP